MTVSRDERIIEKVTRVGRLFDLYGGLLTHRQREMVELYYFDNLSLAEIAEELGVSRQAIHDNLRRAEEQLEAYETTLQLLQTQESEMSQLQQVLDTWAEIQAHVPEPQRNQMQTALSGFIRQRRL